MTLIRLLKSLKLYETLLVLIQCTSVATHTSCVIAPSIDERVCYHFVLKRHLRPGFAWTARFVHLVIQQLNVQSSVLQQANPFPKVTYWKFHPKFAAILYFFVACLWQSCSYFYQQMP